MMAMEKSMKSWRFVTQNNPKKAGFTLIELSTHSAIPPPATGQDFFYIAEFQGSNQPEILSTADFGTAILRFIFWL